MNISVNIDCSPEEARRLMGLPDLSPIHAIYLDKVQEMMVSGVSQDMIDQMMRSWAPVGDMGMNAWKQMIGNMTGSGGSKTKSGGSANG